MELSVRAVLGARCACAASLVIVSACNKGSASHDTVVVVAAAPPASGIAQPACPRTGHWSPCQVKSRLDAAGVAPQLDSTELELPAVGGAPIRYMIGKSALAVYLFADSSARARAAGTLDSSKFIPPSAALTMRGEATAIQNDNLLALLFSRNDLQRERVSDTFMAGAPQP